MDRFAEVRIVLVGSREQGDPFQVAWNRALRYLAANDDLCDLDEDREVLQETKHHFRAAYEGREVTEAERERAEEAAQERLRGLSFPQMRTNPASVRE